MIESGYLKTNRKSRKRQKKVFNYKQQKLIINNKMHTETKNKEAL